MKALVLKRYGGLDQVAFADIPRPTLKPDEILVEVHAAGLNPIDYTIPKGTFKSILRLQLPATLGSDLAGVVVEVGSRVTRFKPDDAVFASIFDLGTGALAEFAVVPESAAATKPANLDFVQAASIPMVGLTSWQALKERAKLQPGQKVFIPAGSGGIGTFAIQLAKHLGAKVGTTTSTDNVALVQSLGADEVIDYIEYSFCSCIPTAGNSRRSANCLKRGASDQWLIKFFRSIRRRRHWPISKKAGPKERSSCR
jgi:NADPH:quinone reductase-like Zn-dependent oxidoreductase